jgi:hypothetical protein
MSAEGGEPASPDPGSPAGARAELVQAGGWAALGLAVLVGSLRMDRLESQHINPYTVPGLLPGLLGIAMLVLAALLGGRAVRHGALAPEARMHRPLDPVVLHRIALVIGLCLVFGVGLVGHGVPFWLAAAIYVTAAILLLERPRRDAAGRGVTLRDVAFALAVGLGAGGMITFVFQVLFLVRLP